MRILITSVVAVALYWWSPTGDVDAGGTPVKVEIVDHGNNG